LFRRFTTEGLIHIYVSTLDLLDQVGNIPLFSYALTVRTARGLEKENKNTKIRLQVKLERAMISPTLPISYTILPVHRLSPREIHITDPSGNHPSLVLSAALSIVYDGQTVRPAYIRTASPDPGHIFLF
jgi:uncharacterized heparinase superfamily protein